MAKSKKINRDDLLEKIVADYTRRVRGGKAPNISAYQNKYPKLAIEIEDLLTSVAMIEGLKIEAQSNVQANETDLSNLKQLGDYLLIREVGRGGMGVVFEAVHQSLGRRVAVKIMRRRDIDDEKYVARFRREAQSAAKLHHTNIVSVFGVGEANGFHYYVMEFIDGAGLNQVVQSLTRRLSGPTIGPPDTFVSPQDDAATRIDNEFEKPTLPDHLPLLELDDSPSFSPSRIPKGRKRFKWLAQVGNQVADALAHAHGQGILHRDIKPANLLLDKKDHVWITDFGLVKENELDGLTKTGDLIGTPQYMAPESFKGVYDQQSETYCLGLTLYELATLRPAFDPGTTAELIHRITTTTPVSPCKIDSKIPRDLNTIIEKSMARDPKLRYATSAELRDDLRAFLEDRPISARKPRLPEQVWRWSRRNPLPATLALLSTLLLCAFSAAVTFGWMSTSTAYEKLEVEAKQTEANRQLAVQNAKEASDNAEKMEVQFKRAEKNVTLIIQAFDEMFKQIISPGGNTQFNIDGLQELGGIETAVSAEDAEFLKRMMVFYEQFAEQNSENKNLLLESARAFRRIANINYLVGETNSAIDAYRSALEFYEPVLENLPTSEVALLNVVNTRAELVAAIRRSGNSKRAQEEIRKNIQAIEAFPNSERPQIQLALAQSLISAGSGYVDLAALDNVSEISDLIDTNNPRSENLNPRRFVNQPSPELDQEFLHDSNRAIEIGKQLIAMNSEEPAYQLLLGSSYSSLAALQMRMKDPEADATLGQATEQFTRLCEDYPDNLKYQYLLALTSLLEFTDQPNSAAKRQIGQIAKDASELITKSPNPEYKQLGILAYTKLAGLQLADGRLQDAVEDQKKAANYLVELDNQVEGKIPFIHLKRHLAANYRIIIETYHEQDERREAARVRDYAMSLFQGEISRERGRNGRPPHDRRRREGGPQDREGPPRGRDGPPPEREGPPRGRDEPQQNRQGPHRGREDRPGNE